MFILLILESMAGGTTSALCTSAGDHRLEGVGDAPAAPVDVSRVPLGNLFDYLEAGDRLLL
jgi:hypothetical protein